MDLADPQQWNGYAYANNNPTTLSDPDGLIPADCREPGIDCSDYHPGSEEVNKKAKQRNPCWPAKCNAAAKRPPPPETCTANTPEYCHSEGTKNEGPYDVLKEWLGYVRDSVKPDNAVSCMFMPFRCVHWLLYRWDDRMTQEMWATPEFQKIAMEIFILAGEGSTGGEMDFHYSEMGLRENFRNLGRDAVSYLSKGELGSTRWKALTGSFDVDWTVVGYQNGNPVVEIHVQNATTLYSGTRIPGVTPARGDGSAGSGADAYPGEYYIIQSYRFRKTVCVSGYCAQ